MSQVTVTVEPSETKVPVAGVMVALNTDGTSHTSEKNRVGKNEALLRFNSSDKNIGSRKIITLNKPPILFIINKISLNVK